MAETIELILTIIFGGFFTSIAISIAVDDFKNS